jgi:hypothetical protein
MDRISHRHEGDLGGQLTSFDETSQLAVAVNVAPDVAHLPSVQHTSWMLISLLSRLAGVVKRLRITCPSDVPLAGRIVPLAPTARNLREALLQGIAELPFVDHGEADESIDFTITVGPVADESATINVYGDSWWGGIFQDGHVPLGVPSALPFGPYIAACLAAAEVFKRVRMRPSDFEACGRVFYSAWTCRCTAEPDESGPAQVGVHIPETVLLAGVGAVGTACLHCLWTLDITGQIQIADNDAAGIDSTNLNRYSLFGTRSLGKPKATEAAALFEDIHQLKILPHDGGFEFFFEHTGSRPAVVLSAVDKNTVRAAIQDQYPALILSASTSDLRPELLRCGPPGVGACLRCFNPPERVATDDEVRAELRANPEHVDDLSANLSFERSAILEWAETGKCGEAGGRLLEFIRRSASEPARFAVGFVSVAAGVMLAAQLIKEFVFQTVPANELDNRAVLQFWNPLARTNTPGRYPRQPGCPKCQPDGIAVTKWLQRYQEFARSVTKR